MFRDRYRVEISQVAFKDHSYEKRDVEEDQDGRDLVRFLAKGDPEVLLQAMYSASLANSEQDHDIDVACHANKEARK